MQIIILHPPTHDAHDAHDARGIIQYHWCGVRSKVEIGTWPRGHVGNDGEGVHVEGNGRLRVCVRYYNDLWQWYSRGTV